MFIESSRWFFSPAAGFSASRAGSKGGEVERRAEARRKIKPHKAESPNVQYPIVAIAQGGVMGCGRAGACCRAAGGIPQLRGEYHRMVCAVEQPAPAPVRALEGSSKGLRRVFEGYAGKVFEASANPREGLGVSGDRSVDHALIDTSRPGAASPGQVLRTRRRPRARCAGINQVHATDQPPADCATPALARSGRWPLSTTTSASNSRAAPPTRCSPPTSCWPRARPADWQQLLAFRAPASQQGPALWMESGKSSAKKAEKNPAQDRVLCPHPMRTRSGQTADRMRRTSELERKKTGSAEAAPQCCALRARGLKSFEWRPGTRGRDA